MNKKVSVYELLGLIKDGKAPEKIKYKNQYYGWGYDTYTDINCLTNTPDVQSTHSIFARYRADYILNDEVEIVEDKKIQYLHYHNANNELEYNGKMYTMRVIDKALVEKIDELIDEINVLKEKGE